MSRKLFVLPIAPSPRCIPQPAGVRLSHLLELSAGGCDEVVAQHERGNLDKVIAAHAALLHALHAQTQVAVQRYVQQHDIPAARALHQIER